MSSKTHGIDPQPLFAGEFRWVWYKLIPTNVSITPFYLEPVRREINARGMLPSGNVYALFAGDQVDFHWEFSASFSFSLKSDMLVSLVTENNINSQEGLTAFLGNVADEVEACVIRILNSTANADELEKILAGTSEILEKKVQEQFYAITNFSCVVKNAHFPDFILYSQVRGLYEEYMAKQREYSASLISEKAEKRINFLLRIDELERYGELLTKYPILMQYIYMMQTVGAE
jgi:hypothetical protein